MAWYSGIVVVHHRHDNVKNVEYRDSQRKKFGQGYDNMSVEGQERKLMSRNDLELFHSNLFYIVL